MLIVWHNTLLAYQQKYILPIAAIEEITVENCCSIRVNDVNITATVRGLFVTDEMRQCVQQFFQCVNNQYFFCLVYTLCKVAFAYKR